MENKHVSGLGVFSPPTVPTYRNGVQLRVSGLDGAWGAWLRDNFQVLCRWVPSTACSPGG